MSGHCAKDVRGATAAHSEALPGCPSPVFCHALEAKQARCTQAALRPLLSSFRDARSSSPPTIMAASSLSFGAALGLRVQFQLHCRRILLRPQTTFITQHRHKSTKKSDPAKTRTAQVNHIDRFFAQYPSFDYQPTAPFIEEFTRLRQQEKWDKGHVQNARREFNSAMVLTFNKMYGKRADALSAWQKLCSALGVEDMPRDIASCKQLVRGKHVNLVDFLQPPEPGTPVRTFSSEGELREYTQEHEKFFPRKDVNAGSLLKCLLRRVG
ncbi:hypothetical protein C8Q80DRAFT_1157047 [Daedaleopsis nitida]|nr:hypothetical protein C8Q80DRAFT_1157047 [Daedaleopsis nitida]